MKKNRKKTDRILRLVSSESVQEDTVVGNNWPEEMIINGDMGIGKHGNPVTIFIEDEVTGETLEINNVRTAFVALEDTRKASSGWLAFAIGGSNRLVSVLSFLSQITLDSLKKLVGN